MAEHTPTACDQCGQTDDHPKLHYGMETYHHDCCPVRVHVDVTAHPVVGPVVAATIDAAKRGVHGDALRAHIAELHAGVPSPAAVAHLDPAQVAAMAAPAAPGADPAAPAAAAAVDPAPAPTATPEG